MSRHVAFNYSFGMKSAPKQLVLVIVLSWVD